jgi:4-hydroxybenzoate polyprenyltransferase
VTVIAVALTASSGRSLWGIAAVGSAVLAGQLTVGWHNDWLDADRDTRARRPDKPVARGDIARRRVGTAALCAGATVAPLSLLSGWRAGLTHILAVGLALAYNAGLKATVVSFLPYLLAFPGLVAFISLGGHGSRWPPWWALLGAALLATGAHLANAAPDLVDDKAAGIRGLPQLLGAPRSIAWSLGLLVGASGVVVLGAGTPTGLHPGTGLVLASSAFLLILVLALVLALWTRRTGPRTRGQMRSHCWRAVGGARTWFRVCMIVALADVALLIARGASL